MNEAPRRQAKAPPGRIREHDMPHQDAGLDVEGLAILRDLDRAQIEPAVVVADTKRQRQPVRTVDESLVCHRAAGDRRVQPVVEAGNVGAGIVRIVGLGLLGGAARREIAVAEGAQGLAQALIGRTTAVMNKRPAAPPAHRPRSRNSISRSMNQPTSSGSVSLNDAAERRGRSALRMATPRPRSAAKASSSVSSSPT